MNPVGELCLRVGLRDGRVRVFGVDSSRPRAEALLAGRTPAEVLRLVPLLYSLCGRAQLAAAELALEAAAGRETSLPRRLDLAREVVLERLREHLWRLWLDWPPLLGQTARRADFAALHRALADPAWGADGAAPAALRAALGLECDCLSGWGAALVQACREAEVQRAALPAPVLLPALDNTAWAARLGAVPDAAFCAAPALDGAPRETGVLARHAGQPEVAAALAAGHYVTARLRARLAAVADELDALVAPRPLAPGAALPTGGGLAGVECARGLLLHAYALDGARVARAAVVAPTEWNFHPRGAFFLEGEGLPGHTETAARRALQALILGLDPCVGYRLAFVGQEGEAEHA